MQNKVSENKEIKHAFSAHSIACRAPPREKTI